MTDWTLIKTQYEILGADVKDLSDKHNVSIELIQNAINTQGWKVQKVAVDEDVNDALSTQMESLQTHHQAALTPKYISLENLFFDKVKTLITNLINADDVKKMAEALAILKPSAMKSADTAAGNVSGGGKIMIINKFETPQPGDKDYIPINAVLMGEHASKNNGLLDVEDANIITIEVPNTEDMN